MEIITSRKNKYIRHLRELQADGDYRREHREFVCDGLKTLKEAVNFGGVVTSILWKDTPETEFASLTDAQYAAPAELFEYASPLKSSPGPVFTVAMPETADTGISRAIVLDGVQDPGNVGTVIRTANAFNIDAVILTGGCADLYNPKTVRATMGAIFRQRVVETNQLSAVVKANGLALYGAALSETARDIREIKLENAAVCIGSEGRGLSREVLDMCHGQLIIPMNPDSESLNAAVAAAVVMWEMTR